MERNVDYFGRAPSERSVSQRARPQRTRIRLEYKLSLLAAGLAFGQGLAPADAFAATANQQWDRMTAEFQGLESTRYAFQEFKRLFYLVKEHEEEFLPEVTKALTAFEARLIEQQSVVEETARTLYNAMQPELARHHLTYYRQTEAGNGLSLGESLADSIEARTKVLYGIRQPAMQPQPNLVKPQSQSLK